MATVGLRRRPSCNEVLSQPLHAPVRDAPFDRHATFVRNSIQMQNVLSQVLDGPEAERYRDRFAAQEQLVHEARAHAEATGGTAQHLPVFAPPAMPGTPFRPPAEAGSYTPSASSTPPPPFGFPPTPPVPPGPTTLIPVPVMPPVTRAYLPPATPSTLARTGLVPTRRAAFEGVRPQQFDLTLGDRMAGIQEDDEMSQEDEQRAAQRRRTEAAEGFAGSLAAAHRQLAGPSPTPPVSEAPSDMELDPSRGRRWELETIE